MKSDLIDTILYKLDQWIELLNDPTSEKWKISYIQERRDRIANDHESIRSMLVDGNIWGGMGSFIDCASLDHFSFRPTTTDQIRRAEQWQIAHKKCDDWQRKFNLVTIELGTALINWCSTHSELKDYEMKSIEKWILFAKGCNERPFRPLNQTEIETLEWNLEMYAKKSCT